MTMRVNVNSLKNAVGTVFLLATAFFVCSTFISMRSVFADPIAPANNALAGHSGRVSPRSTAATTSPRTVSRTAVSRGGGAVSNLSAKTVASRGVGTRSVSGRSITPSRPTTVATRGVTSRGGGATTVSTRGSNNRAVRARTATTQSAQSRVGVSGTVIPANRASTVTYLSNKLYTGSYANIIDSSTGLISADAYSNCLESYYTCMDEICTARSDTKGRCSCAGRATNFLSAEDALEEANEELIKLSGQLSLLIATKGKGEDLQYAFSLTDAEKVMNCVSWKETTEKYGASSDEAKNWCTIHHIYGQNGDAVVTCSMPDYCKTTGTGGNNFGFDISNINGSSSDILAQLKAWADAKDLAKQYAVDDVDSLVSAYSNIGGIINSLSGITDTDTSKAALDSLANRWGYDLFQYAHNNVCGRVLDSCFNGIYESCGTPPTIEESYTKADGTKTSTKTHQKCANGATTNCPFNYNSAISVTSDGEVKLNERGASGETSSSMATCFGYSGTTTTSVTRTTSATTSDPYYSFRGPVADARRSIMQKYLLDANAACDTYGANLRQTAQNINYQKIAAEQALQQKRLEFKQEEESARLASATAAIDNFNECISEIWDCYEEYSDEDTKWTTARIKAYCAQVSQVPHCYEPMICSPLQSQLVAVVDKPDSQSCSYSNDYDVNNCRNVVTINEILYGTGSQHVADLDNWNGIGSIKLNSAAVREQCLQRTLNCNSDTDGTTCLRKWDKTDTSSTSGTTLGNSSIQGNCTDDELEFKHAEEGYINNGVCIITSCEDGYGLTNNNTCVALSND